MIDERSRRNCTEAEWIGKRRDVLDLGGQVDMNLDPTLRIFSFDSL